MNLSLLGRVSTELLVLIQFGKVPSQGHNIHYSALEMGTEPVCVRRCMNYSDSSHAINVLISDNGILNIL
jgi:hypothetical protein